MLPERKQVLQMIMNIQPFQGFCSFLPQAFWSGMKIKTC